MQCLRDLPPKRVLTLCIWHAYLESCKTRRLVPPSTRTVQYMPKPSYIPAASVEAPEVPHFREMIEDDGPPTMSAARECQLCGEGFIDFEHLRRHCDLKHGGWKEYRKRLFFQADQYDAQPLPRKGNASSWQTSLIILHTRYQETADRQSPDGRRHVPSAHERVGWNFATVRTSSNLARIIADLPRPLKTTKGTSRWTTKRRK